MGDVQPDRDPRHHRFLKLVDDGAWPQVRGLLTELRVDARGIRSQERAASYLRTDATYDVYLAELAVLRGHAKERGDVLLMLRSAMIASLIRDGERDRGEAARLEADDARGQERIERAVERAARLVREDDPDLRAPAVLRAGLTTSRTVPEPLVSVIRDLVLSINDWDTARILAALCPVVERVLRDSLEVDVDQAIADLMVALGPCYYCDRGWREVHKDWCPSEHVLPTYRTEEPTWSDHATALSRRVAACDPWRWSTAVEAIAPELETSGCSRVIRIAAGLDDPPHQVAAVRAIAPQLSPQAASEALTEVTTFSNVGVRLLATLVLANQLPRQQRMTLVSDVRTHISQTSDPWLRAQVRWMLARTAEGDQTEEFRRSLADIGSIEDTDERLASLGVAVPELPMSMFRDVIAMASESLSAGGWRFPFQQIGSAFEAHEHDLDREAQRELLVAAVEGLGSLGPTDLIAGLFSLGPWLGSYLEEHELDELEEILKDLARSRW